MRKKLNITEEIFPMPVDDCHLQRRRQRECNERSMGYNAGA